FILFQHNCHNPDQVRGLVADLRDAVGRPDAPVLIDQEGGRVQRLRPPHWRAAPSAGDLANLPEPIASEAVRLNARLMAEELSGLGITVDCAPVLDVPRPGADPVIGDRAYGDDPERIAALGRAACEGFLAGGVLPIIKHVPGHGRADADSHMALPRVEASMDDLWDMDFKPFCELNDMPWAMTAHVLYTAIDDKNPATLSATTLDMVRDDFGFGGVLVSDSLSMKALSGSLAERTAAALKAGCDLALYCHGKMDEMRAVAGAAARLSDLSMARIDAAESLRVDSRQPMPEDYDAAVARLEGMLTNV
ncbi:MAG: beta-N-acetylhexosaminidase, partial [Alphaproteobacteria bacterium]